MALQIPHATAQASGGEEIFECSGDEEDQRILSEEKSIDRLSNYRESVRAKVVQQSDENGLISSQSITPSEAFEVFQGKIFSCRTEFSLPDSVERRVETPMQRYTRLRMELEELRNDLDAMSAEKEKPSDSTIWSTLQAEAKKLIQQSETIEGHKGFEAFNRKASSLPSRLYRVMAAETSTSTVKSSTNSAPITESSTTTHAVSDVSQLERRVFALETFLGSSSNSVDMEAAQRSQGGVLGFQEDSGTLSAGGSFPLIDNITRLEKRLSMLDPLALDTLRSKATALKNELESASRVKTSPADLQVIESVKKVDDLYEKINRVQAVATDLPALILRLKTLETVHRQSASFALNLKNIESLAQSTMEDLKSNKDVLNNLKEGLAENLKIIKADIQEVDGKLSKRQNK